MGRGNREGQMMLLDKAGLVNQAKVWEAQESLSGVCEPVNGGWRHVLAGCCWRVDWVGCGGGIGSFVDGWNPS